MLEVSDVHTYYGDSYVLQGVYLRVERGQVVGVGPHDTLREARSEEDRRWGRGPSAK